MRTFTGSFLITIAAIISAYFYAGLHGVAIAALLGVLEISLSFDNAIVNAAILQKMSPLWQKVFLTLGILIAAFGMRFIFPLLIVWVTAGVNPICGLHLAFHPPTDHSATYASLVQASHHQIAAFGGVFLLMLFLDFLTSGKEHYWLKIFEVTPAKIEGINRYVKLFFIALMALGILGAIECLSSYPIKSHIITLWGLAGAILYVIVNFLGDTIEPDEDNSTIVKRGALAGLGGFLYLEIIDASFSFDGVIGAFAITTDPILIILGLGFIGAMFVRSLTVYLVKKDSLSEFIYLEHGAQWAIGVVSIILLLSIDGLEVPDVITGLIGVVFIGLALLSSVIHNKREVNKIVEEKISA